jgi:hypothetical protein
MMSKLPIASLLAFAALFASCEKDITLDLPQPDERLVVEGRITSGSFPYLLLTRNGSFFAPSGDDVFSDMFVHDAEVYIEVDGQRYMMTEYCLSTLPASLRPLVYSFLGMSDFELPTIDICVYISLDITGSYGEQYNLEITKAHHHLTATTTIPHAVPIDSMWYRPEPGNDTLVALWVRIPDPDTPGNFYRYFTKRNSEPFYPGYFGSVWDDRLLNGQTVGFTLDRGYPPGASFEWSSYGKFIRGDTIILNINAIDKATFDFWSTFEEQKRSGGPLATPTYIRSNIIGGLGIWGGYGSIFDTLLVPK